MTREQYLAITERINRSPQKRKMICMADFFITYGTAIFYVIFFVWCFFFRKDYLYPMILVSGTSFLCVSFFRTLLSEPRPYEKYAFTPVIEREKKGKGFPSRHVFSAFMIGMTVWYSNERIWVIMGIICLVLGMLLAVVRVIGGVHFIRDVFAGALVGILSAVLGYGVIFGKLLDTAFPFC